MAFFMVSVLTSPLQLRRVQKETNICALSYENSQGTTFRVSQDHNVKTYVKKQSQDFHIKHIRALSTGGKMETENRV